MADNKNMDLWNKVSETDPNQTKEVKQRGGFTSIGAQYQIMLATQQFGTYGNKWGVKDITYDYIDNDNSKMALVEAMFYYPDGEFPIHSSIIVINNGRFDDEFAKKVLTDITTKALSKLGFNADVFMGMYDDNRYVNDLKKKYGKSETPKEKQSLSDDRFLKAMEAYATEPDKVKKSLRGFELTSEQKKALEERNIKL